jgi:hypothetical protein
MIEETKIKDSGERRQFETGAVRDISDGKGRFDLLPLDVLYMIFSNSILKCIDLYQKENDVSHLLQILSCNLASSKFELTEKIAKRFEEGAKKYEENNWRKGIPCKCYIDSAVRHYFKWQFKEIDEDHEAAFYWNVMCCIWTHENIPEMQSYKKGGN